MKRRSLFESKEGCQAHNLARHTAVYMARDEKTCCHSLTVDVYARTSDRQSLPMSLTHKLIISNALIAIREAPFANTRTNSQLSNAFDLTNQTNLIMFNNSSLSKISNQICHNINESMKQIDRVIKWAGMLGSLANWRAIMAGNRFRLLKPPSRRISHDSRAPDLSRVLLISSSMFVILITIILNSKFDEF